MNEKLERLEQTVTASLSADGAVRVSGSDESAYAKELSPRTESFA